MHLFSGQKPKRKRSKPAVGTKHGAPGSAESLAPKSMRLWHGSLKLLLRFREYVARRAVLSRFPYALYFRMTDDSIVVLAVHGRQDLSRWQKRS